MCFDIPESAITIRITNRLPDANSGVYMTTSYTFSLIYPQLQQHFTALYCPFIK